MGKVEETRQHAGESWESLHENGTSDLEGDEGLLLLVVPLRFTLLCSLSGGSGRHCSYLMGFLRGAAAKNG